MTIDKGHVQIAGVRLSPNGESQGVNDSNPAPLFEAAAARLAADCSRE